MDSKILSNVYICSNYSIAGPLENSGVLKDCLYMDDFYYGAKSVDDAEIKINSLVINNLLNDKVKLIIGGNLNNQITGISYAIPLDKVAYLGIYGACSTFIEGLIIATKFVNKADVMVVTSSHNLTSEKQFRYPIEYGGPLKPYSTFTATGSVGALVSKTKSKVRIESYTIGNVIDYGIDDVFNMGAVMAPSAFESIKKHLKDLKRNLDYYDLVLTGDLGKYGLEILKEMLMKDNISYKEILDAGDLLYIGDQKKCGGSGPVCLPLILFNNILDNKKYKKILLVGTGSLHSKVMVNERKSIPSISHIVSLEVS